jgi:hypothetical protein
MVYFCGKGYEMLCKAILKAGLCVLIVACARSSAVENEDSNNALDANKPKVAPTATEAAKKEADNGASEVIVRLGNDKLTMKEIRWRFPEPDNPQIAALANMWLETELLYREADKRGVTNDPRAKFFADIMRKTAFAEELRREVQESVKISDEDVLAYYEKNKNTDAKLQTRGDLTFSHIRTKSLAEAQACLNRLKAGENINELAKKLSSAPDARRGGTVKELSYITTERRYSREFMEKLRSAKEGEIIGPVAVGRDNYEVARKDGETKPVPLPFADVKDKLKSQLERTKSQESLKSLMDSLKKTAADQIVKSPRLIEAEKAAPERPEPQTPKPTRAPRPAPAPTPKPLE